MPPMRNSLNKVSFSAGGTNNDKLAEREGGNCAHVTCVYRMHTGAFSFRIYAMAHVIPPTESTNYTELSATIRGLFMVGKPFTVCFGMGKDKNSETENSCSF